MNKKLSAKFRNSNPIFYFYCFVKNMFLFYIFLLIQIRELNILYIPNIVMMTIRELVIN